MQNNGDRPKRALIAYCALADRLKTHGASALQSLIPFLRRPVFSSRASYLMRKNFPEQLRNVTALTFRGLPLSAWSSILFTRGYWRKSRTMGRILFTGT